VAGLGASLFLHHHRKHDEAQPWGSDPGGPEAVVDGVRDAQADPDAPVHHTGLDLTAPDAPDQLVARAVDALGHVDILVCNHALSGSDGPLGTLDARMRDAHWAVNTRARGWVRVASRCPRTAPRSTPLSPTGCSPSTSAPTPDRCGAAAREHGQEE
jgi:NAD(P)-dependent dehydrogenase (short-subunit alcohol dehydrogenase family)